MPEFTRLIARLKREYGDPVVPPAQGPFELVIWENACYLMPDERRAAVFHGLRAEVGLSATALLNADRSTLLRLAKIGGMRPEERVARWLDIARITAEEFKGDLNRILRMPYAEARKALKRFPVIGDPGADKILLFCGCYPGLPLESNSLRVLSRVGYGTPQKGYSSTYRSIQEDLTPQLRPDSKELITAHLLLRQHGKELCHTNKPLCGHCPIADLCSFSRNLSPTKLPRNTPPRN